MATTLWDKVVKQVDRNISLSDAPYLGGTLGPAETNPFDQDPVVNFSKSNSSYSGTDCTCMVQLNNKIIVLGNVETFSHSIHREKTPVRVLGRSHPKGYTAGGRTIAGSIVFIVFDRAPLWDVIKEIDYVRNPSDRTTSPLPDQLPPLDLILLFQNEYGHQSIVRLYGVEFIDEGQTYSINDLYSECMMSYVARDMDQMIAYEDIGDFKDMMFERQVRGQFIDNQYQAMLEYKSNLEGQIAYCDSVISNIDMEIGRRAILGFDLPGANYYNPINWLSNIAFGKDQVTLNDLKKEKDKQVKIKTNLLNELNKVNTMISQRQTSGWNAQAGMDAGNMQTDGIFHAPSSKS